MSAIKPVDLDVVKIEPGRGDGIYHIAIRFHSTPDKVYDYYRATKRQPNEAPREFAVIAGVKIIFNPYNCELVRTERLYDTKGGVRLKNATQTKHTPRVRAEIRTPQEEFTEEELKEAVEAITPTEEVEEEPKPEEEPKIVEVPKKVKHEKYEQILTCLENDIPVYLSGPAGSGKNHTVEQIAKEKGWNFYFSNSVQQEYKLTGFIDAGGKYHETEFYKALTDEEECIFFLDEIDASIPEVLVLLNAAIANGYFEFPNGRIDFDHVHFVAAGNTVGSGADDLYTGRMVLDQATLDRFAIIKFDYDERVELKLSRGNAEMVRFIRELRKYATDKDIRATFSYRCISMLTKLEKAGMPLKDAMEITVLKGMDKDTILSLNLIMSSNKYYETLLEIKKELRGW